MSQAPPVAPSTPPPIPKPAAAAAHVLPWLVYASEGRFSVPPHLRWIGGKLMDVYTGRVKRLVVSCPPRHGKTVTIAQFFASWWLGRRPSDRVIYVTMQERFSRKWGRAARDVFSRFAEAVWGVTCHKRASTAEWDVLRDGHPTGGSMSSIGAQGTITGKGANLVIVDDLIRSRKEAQNQRLMEEIYEWFESAVLTRLEPDAAVVVLMTRWVHDDLIGVLKKKQEEGELGEEWVFINLPALAEEDDPLGRAPGEALWPARYSAETLLKKARDVGSYVWTSLYQGRPTPTSGDIFQAAWFKTYERHGDLVTIVDRGTCHVSEFRKFGVADLAASRKRRGDWTVITAWGYHPTWNVLVLLGLERKRFKGPDYTPAFRRAVETHDLPIVYVERETSELVKRLGFSVVKEGQRAGLPLVEIAPDVDKESRAHASTGSFAAGLVWFPESAKADYRPGLEAELLTFPAAKHDDQVDCVTYAVGIFRELMSREQPASEEREDDGGDPFWSGLLTPRA